MFNENVINTDEIYVKENKRSSTDFCCTVISALFALILFILAIIFFSKANYDNSYYGFSANSCSRQFVHYTDPTNAATRTCVNSCPNGFASQGSVCWPTSPTIANQYLQNPSIINPTDAEGFKNSLIWTILLSLGLGFIWIIFVQFFPKLAPYAAIVLAAISLITLGIFALIGQSSFLTNSKLLTLVVAIFAFVLAALLIGMGCYYSNQLRLQGIFLEYSRRFLHQYSSNFIYILIFVVATIGLFALCTFQYFAFSTNSNNPGFLGLLNILEFIWGLRFLRDAYFFCISGSTVDWYWNHQISQNTPHRLEHHWYASFDRLLSKNWGSVAGGSFVNAFFEIPTFIIELFVCHPGTCCSKIGTICQNKCSAFSFLTNLVRSDSYTYINISGIPYCNASRECAKICYDNNGFVGSQNPLKYYRLATHIFAVTLLSFFGYIFAEVRMTYVGFWHVALIIAVTYATITWFIDIFAAAAEGISVNFYVDHFSSHGFQYMKHAIPTYRKQIELRSSRSQNMRDGNC